jgi:hypothetical protein
MKLCEDRGALAFLRQEYENQRKSNEIQLKLMPPRFGGLELLKKGEIRWRSLRLKVGKSKEVE